MAASIAINGRFLTQGLTGVQRFAKEIVLALDAMLEEHPDVQCELLCPRAAERLPLNHIVQRRVGFWGGQAWEQCELPWYARGATLVNLCNLGPLITARQCVVMHDAAVFGAPDGYTVLFRTWYRFAQRLLARRAARLATVSHFSASELEKHLDVKKDGIVVIENAVDHLERVGRDPLILDRLDLRGRSFLLAVGSQNPNKNTQRLTEAVARLGNAMPLVLVGGANASVFAAEMPLSQSSTVITAGYVSDEALASLMEAASLFVFPSLYEGFGIPPLEAMWCGCPVAVSRIPAVVEACGDAALYFDPLDVEQMAEVISGAQRSPESRSALIDAGRRRSRARHWRGQAENLLNVVLAIPA